MELAEFLLARIAEDEAVARSRDMSRPIHFVGCYYYEHTLDANLYCDCDEDGSATRRILAECDAKRRIVERLRDDAGMAETLRAQTASTAEWFLIVAARDTLKLLALPYADHPDYREEWRP